MSWLARSITNSLKFVDDDGDEDDVNPDRELEDKDPESPESQTTDASSPNSPSRGVKEDLSDFSKTLTRQFWGVASFLAPPPQSEQKPEADVPESEEDPMLGIRGDFAEIGWRFRSGISRLSNNINVSEITKMASNLLQLESDESEASGKNINLDSLGNEAVGVTEEVVAFARDVSMHPETWLDFPLLENDADFDMSDPQQEHALAVDRLAPRLAALRLELCPAYMSESHFWKIYFVLLHPRLDKQDAQLLSTPQIVEARSLLAQELKNRKAIEHGNSPGKKSSDSEENSSSSHDEPLSVPSPVISENIHDNTTDLSDTTTAKATSDIRKHPHPEEITEIQIEDKQVIAENDPVINNLTEKDEDEADDWLEEETPEIGNAPGKTIAIEDNDDVSFSDLEEDDDDDASTSIGNPTYGSDRDTCDWVRL